MMKAECRAFPQEPQQTGTTNNIGLLFFKCALLIGVTFQVDQQAFVHESIKLIAALVIPLYDMEYIS